MNEAAWLTGADPTPMLKFAQGKLRRRAVRLFACACCRRLWHLLPADSRTGVEVAERFADGRASTAELDEAHARASAAVLAVPTNIWSFEVLRSRFATSAVSDCTKVTAGTIPDALAVASTAADARALDGALTGAKSAFNTTREEARAVELASQAEVVRELFGNPYRPPRFSPDWATDTAVLLARQMYEAHEFSAMPILADALQDAGCDSDAILDHCRDTSLPHLRGCWVLDLVLGKGSAELDGFPRHLTAVGGTR